MEFTLSSECPYVMGSAPCFHAAHTVAGRVARPVPVLSAAAARCCGPAGSPRAGHGGCRPFGAQRGVLGAPWSGCGASGSLLRWHREGLQAAPPVGVNRGWGAWAMTSHRWLRNSAKARKACGNNHSAGRNMPLGEKKVKLGHVLSVSNFRSLI